MAAPTNVWTDELEASDEWGPHIRGTRLLERPSGTRLVSAVWELDPGASSPQYHVHHATEELLLVLAGDGTLRTPAGERTLTAGDIVHFPLGSSGAHQVLNRSSEVVRYLMIGAHSNLDVIEYVDEGRIIVYSNSDSLLQPEQLFFSHELPADA